uniref:Elongator complex protein 4 n=1 Tax=Hirondellea gigas TaxID=1518452 RepID=A0A2P2I2E5_9CRUS
MTSRGGFKPKGKRVQILQLPGTKVSVHHAQLQVSTGIPSLDTVLGGGVPIGSLLLLEEDNNEVYSTFFTKCFLAEGATAGHELLVASLDTDPQKLVAELPAPVIEKNEHNHDDSGIDDSEMKIAWRYQKQTKVSNFEDLDSCGHHYDLKSTMPSEILDKVEIFCWSGSCITKKNDGDCSFNPYKDLFKKIHTLLTHRQLLSSCKRSKPNIMRIAIQSLASFSWGDEISSSLDEHRWTQLTTFLACIRALLRQSYCVAFITVPSLHFTDQALISRLSYHADYVLGLESFQGTDREVNPLFKDYHGLLNIFKIAAYGCLVPPQIDTKDWVFRLKRKKLCIEKLHLPPDLSETASRTQADPVKSAASMCGGLPNKLDF